MEITIKQAKNVIILTEKENLSLSEVPTDELVEELLKRKDIQKFECGLYQKYMLVDNYLKEDQPKTELPPWYYAVVIPQDNFHKKRVQTSSSE